MVQAVYHMPTSEDEDPTSSMPLALQNVFYKVGQGQGGGGSGEVGIQGPRYPRPGWRWGGAALAWVRLRRSMAERGQPQRGPRGRTSLGQGGRCLRSGICRAHPRHPSASHPSSTSPTLSQLQFTPGPVSTKDLTRSFGWDTSDAFQQHDVHELYRILCDRLEEKLKVAAEPCFLLCVGSHPCLSCVLCLPAGPPACVPACVLCGWRWGQRTGAFLSHLSTCCVHPPTCPTLVTLPVTPLDPCRHAACTHPHAPQRAATPLRCRAHGWRA